MMFLVYMAFATWLITWLTIVVGKQAATFEATTCRQFDSVWDLPITSYGPCISATLVR